MAGTGTKTPNADATQTVVFTVPSDTTVIEIRFTGPARTENASAVEPEPIRAEQSRSPIANMRRVVLTDENGEQGRVLWERFVLDRALVESGIVTPVRDLPRRPFTEYREYYDATGALVRVESVEMSAIVTCK